MRFSYAPVATPRFNSNVQIRTTLFEVAIELVVPLFRFNSMQFTEMLYRAARFF